MSSKVQVAYIDIRVFSHATEDPDKVVTALHNTLPADQIEKIDLVKANITGHHGNPIVLIEARIKDRNTAQAILQKLAAGLSMMDKGCLGSKIQQHLEKGNLYFRLDKQGAYLNELKLGQTDSIHYRVHFKKHDPEDVLEICRGFGLIP